ncbi:MAG: hypothetical protein EOO13_17485 [Chitinophagaceae bacterium]|nr:MAG: hypothetical protein EOO13_17485 [Chitinophagaceae bacterium]
MTTTIKQIALQLLAATLLFSSCKKSNGGEGNDEELITTMKLTFTPSTGGSPVTFNYNDADGAGGANPTQDVIQLAPNTIYNVSVALLNATTTPPEDITTEIEEEKEAHRFYYIPSAGGLLTIAVLDADANAVPVGITSQWTTGAASSGTVGITLRHYPGTPPDKQTSDPVNSPKSGTDIAVTFSYAIM